MNSTAMIGAAALGAYAAVLVVWSQPGSRTYRVRERIGKRSAWAGRLLGCYLCCATWTGAAAALLAWAFPSAAEVGGVIAGSGLIAWALGTGWMQRQASPVSGCKGCGR